MRSTSRTVLPVLAGLLILMSAWLAWQAWQVNRDLNSAADDATTLRAAVQGGDEAAADQALSSLQDHSAAAADRTSGVAWSALARLPMVGDDADGVRLVSRVAA